MKGGDGVKDVFRLVRDEIKRDPVSNLIFPVLVGVLTSLLLPW